jgi:magnesium transporter
MGILRKTLKERILECLDAGNKVAIADIAENNSPTDIAEEIKELPIETIWKILQSMEVHRAGEVMGYFDINLEVELAESAPKEVLAPFISNMLSDEGADLLSELSTPLRNSLIPLMAKAKREQLIKLSSYEEGTCGALMTADYLTIGVDGTAKDALKYVQIEATDKEFVYYIYVLDSDEKLNGVISMKDLVLSHPMKKVSELMFEEVLSVNPQDDQEIAIDIIEEYDLMAIPVTSLEGKLLGVITHDDMMDAVRQEETEDIEKIMGIAGEHESEGYLRKSAWQHFKDRIPWIGALSVFQLLTGFVISYFEGTLSSLVVLVIYMPQMVATGGNAGSQSSTVIVRALSTKELTPGLFFTAISREFVASLLMALSLAVIAFGKVFVLSGSSLLPQGVTIWHVSLLVSLALGVQVITAMTIGALLPILAYKVKLDPAVVASPALTTIVDVSGMLIYFGLARLLIPL